MGERAGDWLDQVKSRVGKAKRAHQDVLAEKRVGTAQERLCPPYEGITKTKRPARSSPAVETNAMKRIRPRP
jgi:hypothetical protein